MLNQPGRRTITSTTKTTQRNKNICSKNSRTQQPQTITTLIFPFSSFSPCFTPFSLPPSYFSLQTGVFLWTTRTTPATRSCTSWRRTATSDSRNSPSNEALPSTYRWDRSIVTLQIYPNPNPNHRTLTTNHIRNLMRHIRLALPSTYRWVVE